MTAYPMNPKQKQACTNAGKPTCKATCKPTPKPIWPLYATVAVASMAAVIAAGDRAGAAGGRHERSVEAIETRAVGEPILAVVALRNQRITVYDSKGWILRAPVSSGQTGRETPAGIFSVIQKEAEHYSNLYDDAFMPHMQRITWSGIALHGGPLPGYAASHGCVRMPYDFAERLFGMTKVGMRVIIAPSDVTPVEITHPALFTMKSSAVADAAAKAAEADAAAAKAEQARLAAGTASREAARATTAVRVLEDQMRKTEAQVAAAERAASSGSAKARARAEDVKAKADARIAEIEAQLATAKDEVQPKLDAAAAAREAAATADAAKAAAAEEARKLSRALQPVSVFISRKTQRLYIRQAFAPILETPITIKDAYRPIGTHVFTALERSGGDGMRWSVLSMYGGHPDGGAAEPASGRGGRPADAIATDPSSAAAALGRIVIPQDAMDRIAGMASPRSSLIISDEGPSTETGKGTDFVVVISDEPQDGIKFRRRTPATEVHYRSRAPSWGGGFPFARPYGGYGGFARPYGMW